LETSDEGTEHSTELVGLRQQGLNRIRLADTDLTGQDEMRFEFLEASLDDAKEVDVRAGILPSVPFSDVGGD
jgi:hypothetical protein